MMAGRFIIFSLVAALVAAAPITDGSKPPVLIEESGFGSVAAAPTPYVSDVQAEARPTAPPTAAPTSAVFADITIPPTTTSAPVITAAVSTAAPVRTPEAVPSVPVTPVAVSDVLPAPTPADVAIAAAAPVSEPETIPAVEITPVAPVPDELPAPTNVTIPATEPVPDTAFSASVAAPASTPKAIPSQSSQPPFSPVALPVAAPVSAPETVPAVASVPDELPAPVATAVPAVTISGDKCNFRFCVATPTTFTVGKSIDTSFTGAVCHKNGTLIGTVDQSGEAYLMDGTLISKYAPAGLKQPFTNSFFKTFSLKPEHKFSGIGHETPQQNQGDFLDGRTWILPMKVFQILNEEGHVTAELVGGKYDCIKFSTSITTPEPQVPVPTPAVTEPAAITGPPIVPPVKTEPPVAPPVKTDPPVPAPNVCYFHFCDGITEYTVGKSADAAFTGKICRKDKLIGTIDESGEAYLENKSPISKYSPTGLTQKYSPVFFRTVPIKSTKYVYSGIAHQLPQQNQGQYLDGKTWILPLKAYQVLDSKGHVTAELVGGKNDCIKFSTKV